MGIFTSLFSKNNKVNAPATPTYYTDPNFSGTQDFLKKYSEGILQGNIPDYYKAIGETADKGMMGDYVSDSTRDIYKADLEAGALTGRGRTGISSDALATAGNIGGTLRYNDYLRAMQGRAGLMDLGMTGETGVRTAAAGNQEQKNMFDQWKYEADLAQEMRRAQQANAASAKQWGGVDQGVDLALAAMTGGMSSAIPSFADSASLFSANNPLALKSSIPTTPLSTTMGVIQKKKGLDYGNTSFSKYLASRG